MFTFNVTSMFKGLMNDTPDLVTVVNNGSISKNSGSYSLGGTKDNNEIHISIEYVDDTEEQLNADSPLEVEISGDASSQLILNNNEINGFLSIFTNKYIKYLSTESTTTKSVIKELNDLSKLDTADVKELIIFRNDPRSLESFDVKCTCGTDSVTMNFFIENDYDTGRYFVQNLVQQTINNKVIPN